MPHAYLRVMVMRRAAGAAHRRCRAAHYAHGDGADEHMAPGCLQRSGPLPDDRDRSSAGSVSRERRVTG